MRRRRIHRRAIHVTGSRRILATGVTPKGASRTSDSTPPPAKDRFPPSRGAYSTSRGWFDPSKPRSRKGRAPRVARPHKAPPKKRRVAPKQPAIPKTYYYDAEDPNLLKKLGLSEDDARVLYRIAGERRISLQVLLADLVKWALGMLQESSP